MNFRYIANVSHPITESRTGRILSAVDRITKEKVALKFVFVPNSEANGLGHAQLRETAVWGLVSAYARVIEEAENEETKIVKVNDVSDEKNIPILKLIDVFPSGASVVYVSKEMKSDLHSFLSLPQPSNTVIDIHMIKHILKRILIGVDFLHRRCNVMHRDLKPHNIFVDYDVENNGSRRFPRIFIGDFGLSRCCADADAQTAEGRWETTRPMTHEVVSRAYRAPELLLGCGRCLIADSSNHHHHHHHHSIDMWSVGCIAVDLASAIGRASAENSNNQNNDKNSHIPLPPSLFAASSGSDLEQLGKIYDLIGTPSPQVQEKLMAMMLKNNHPSNHQPQSFFVSFSHRSPLKDWSGEIAKSYLARCGATEVRNFADFLQRLLCNDPSERMTARHCLSHPFLINTAATTNLVNFPLKEKVAPWFAVSGSEKKMEDFIRE